jgi:RNA 2',3'-cyclic 3'-phosphodiesterase
MRLFFAAFPDDETRRLIASAATALALADGACLVPCENYHITLAFVGEVSNSQAASLRTIGPLEVPAFTVRFDTYEHWLRSAVVVLTASACPPALRELQCKLRGELARHEFASDPRPFDPHITIARKVVQAPVQQAMSGFLWTVAAFQLVRSVRSTIGSTYTVLDHWALLDKPVRGK